MTSSLELGSLDFDYREKVKLHTPTNIIGEGIKKRSLRLPGSRYLRYLHRHHIAAAANNENNGQHTTIQQQYSREPPSSSSSGHN